MSISDKIIKFLQGKDPEAFKKASEQVPTSKQILDEIPAYLKNPANFMPVQKALLENFASTHSHSEMSRWASCVGCMSKFSEHASMMKRFGFKSAVHYLTWKKIHDYMRIQTDPEKLIEYNKNALPKYDEPRTDKRTEHPSSM